MGKKQKSVKRSEDIFNPVRKTVFLSNGVNRRKFIAGAAASVASFAVIKPSLVFGTEANSKIEAGVIGLGGRGSLIAGMLNANKGFKVVSVADYFPEAAQRAGESLNIPQERRFSGLSGYKKLIDSKVDAVFLETPPCFFPEHCAAAIEAGCHVYMAKPVAIDVPGCLAVSELGKKATGKKLVFLVDFQTRTDPFIIESVKRCHEGLIGKLVLLSSLYSDEAFPDPPKTETIESRLHSLIWVNDNEIGGGMLVNAGIHAIDLALWIAAGRPVNRMVQGKPKSAMGCARTGKPDPHGDTCDVYSVTYQFDDGLILNHRGEHINNTHGFVCNCFVFGQYGYMEADYEGKAYVRGNKGGYRGGEVKNLYVDGISRNLDTFHKSIVEGIYDNPTVGSSVDSTLTTILGREAGRRNTLLTMDEVIKENKKLEPNLKGLKE
jgi:predicted dehydrogenase